eukprot:scaffold1143_cov177-Amphora_coffeaeformis.AAC.8
MSPGVRSVVVGNLSLSFIYTYKTRDTAWDSLFSSLFHGFALLVPVETSSRKISSRNASVRMMRAQLTSTFEQHIEGEQPRIGAKRQHHWVPDKTSLFPTRRQRKNEDS